MYDYMQALQKKFDSPPSCETLRRELDEVHTDLHQRLNRDEQKLLLRLIDLQCAMQDEISLHSFFSGYKLASGICGELAQERPYFFDEDEEKVAAKTAPQNKEETK